MIKKCVTVKFPSALNTRCTESSFQIGVKLGRHATASQSMGTERPSFTQLGRRGFHSEKSIIAFLHSQFIPTLHRNEATVRWGRGFFISYPYKLTFLEKGGQKKVRNLKISQNFHMKLWLLSVTFSLLSLNRQNPQPDF